MKTQVFKNSESVKSSNMMMFVTMVIFSGILLFVNINGQSSFWNDSLNATSEPEYTNSYPISSLVSGSFAANKTIEKSVNTGLEIATMNEKSYSKNLKNEMAKDLLYSKMKHAVLAQTLEIEQPLELEGWMTDEKFWNCKVAINREAELPLQLEEWMLNEKNWNYELREAVLTTGKNKD